MIIDYILTKLKQQNKPNTATGCVETVKYDKVTNNKTIQA